MRIDREGLHHAALVAAFCSAIAILISISASQILLGISLAALLTSRSKVQLPRIWIPLGLFLFGTVISLLFSPEPLHGLPQIKKMYVFTMLIVITSTVREIKVGRLLIVIWTAIGALVACFGVIRVAVVLSRAYAEHQPLYAVYMENRFTGFMSHVMTYAGEQMIVFLMLLSLLFFAPGLTRRALWITGGSAALLGAGLIINGTRTVWLGVGAAGIWLLWRWKRWVAAAAPAALLILIWLVPGPVHDRFRSILYPQKDIDSNEFRVICIKTGIRMIEAHPWLGIGLDETKYHFLDYLPPDTRQPRPPGFYEHLHNFYLQFAAERGIATLAMMLWMLLLIIYDFQSALKRLPRTRSDLRFLLHGGIAAVIGVMVSGVFEVNLGDSEVLTTFLIVVGIGYAVIAQIDQASRSASRSEQMTAVGEATGR